MWENGLQGVASLCSPRTFPAAVTTLQHSVRAHAHPPSWALRKRPPTGGGAEQPVGRDEAASKDEGSRPIVCAACGHAITDKDAACMQAGRHRHTCVNPAGIVYRIRCFRRAPGVSGVGEWTDYYSWFAGYAWQVAQCAGCGAHLGWGFRGEGSPFHGLIAERIVERDQ